MKNKIYLVEKIDSDILALLEKEFIITNKLEEANILITRNLYVNKDFIDRAINLELVCIHGTGISEVDIDYLHKKNIKVFNTPYLNVEAVAEFAVLLALEASRKCYKELFNKKACIIGYGHIGKRIHELLKSFNMEIIPYKRGDDLELAINDSDYIFLALSLNDLTYHFINEKTLKYFKTNSILINIARGDLVDEEALIKALKNHDLLYYASDVFHNEPNINPIFKELNCIAYNHEASHTKEALYQMGMSIYNGIKNYLENKKIDNLL